MHNNIFSIDDNRVTQMLSQKIFSRTAFTKKYFPFINGVKAIGYFYQLNKMDTKPDKIPAVIFPDINMPVIGG